MLDKQKDQGDRQEVTEAKAAPEVQKNAVIGDTGNQARWNRAQQAHYLGQDESATDLFREPRDKKQGVQKFELFDSEAEETKAAFQKTAADQVLIASSKTPNVPNLEQMQEYQDIQSDSEKPKIAQYSDGYMPPPTILPDFIIKAGIDIWNGTEKPFAGVEGALMAATTASNAHAWEDAAKRFPQLAGVSSALMKAYTRNELAFYGREDLAQDMAAADGHSLGSNPTLGMAQITKKGVHEFEQKYPQLRAFLASKGYSGPGHEMQALLDPECVPMIVAAKTASTVEDMQKHGIKKPTNEQIAYAYNPDVFSYPDGKGGKEFKALYGLEINASQASHWDQHKEYYAKDPYVIEASKHIKNVLSWLK
ncbi:MAG: hypothetical protein C0464_04270 [Cyanobacteria bacterium DS2.008]|nr:hypothetical protein [Cyanobacteria bacterium DS2.008]